MGRPTELDMESSEPSVATEIVEFHRIDWRLSSTSGLEAVISEENY